MYGEKDRDHHVIEDYHNSKTVAEISRTYGISVRRVYQILEMHGVETNRNRGARRQVSGSLSGLHERLGRRVYDHYYDLGLERSNAASQLGWSIQKLRSVETGTHNLTLFDVQDLAAWMKVTLEELLHGRG